MISVYVFVLGRIFMIKVKRRHRFMFRIANPFVSIFLRKNFNYTHESSDIRAPFLLLCNHTMDFDPFFVAKSFKDQIYFVMSDHVSSLRAGKLIKFLVSPIPITKSTIDAGTVLDILRVVQQGGAVGIFPEGNKSFAGDMSRVKPSIAKLIKKLNIPVVIYNIEGGYFSSPRWSKVKRKGHIHGSVKRILTPEEYADMSFDEIYDIVKTNLHVNAYEIQKENKVRYIAENRAKGIEAMMYVCPLCKNIGTVYGEGNFIKCRACNLNSEYDEYGNLSNMKFSRLDEFDKWQKKHLYTIDVESISDDDILLEDSTWEVQKKINKFKSKIIGNFTSILRKRFLELKNEFHTIKIMIDNIAGMAIEGACGVQLWLTNGDVYRLKNDSGHMSGLKYVNFISRLKNEPYNF